MTKMELESFAKDPRTELLSGEESLHHITVLKLNRNIQKAKNQFAKKFAIIVIVNYFR